MSTAGGLGKVVTSGARSVERGFFDDAAVDIGEGMDEDEGGRGVLLDERADAANLKACDDAVEDVLLGVRPASPPLIDRHAAREVADDGLTNLFAPLRDDDDGRVLFEAVEQEVYGLRGGEVGQDGVERGLDAEEEGGRSEDEDVEDENHIADAEQAAALAPKGRRARRAIEPGPAADGQSYPCADEEAAEDGRQKSIRRYVGEVDEGEAEREAPDGRRALQGEAGAELFVAEGDAGGLKEGEEDRERPPRHVRQKHRDARPPAVDEAARQQKTLEAESGRGYPARHEEE